MGGLSCLSWTEATSNDDADRQHHDDAHDDFHDGRRRGRVRVAETLRRCTRGPPEGRSFFCPHSVQPASMPPPSPHIFVHKFGGAALANAAAIANVGALLAAEPAGQRRVI